MEGNNSTLAEPQGSPTLPGSEEATEVINKIIGLEIMQ